MRPYPYSREKSLQPDAKPWNHPSWESDFRANPMGTPDFEWSFVDIRNLKEMRDVMMGKILPDTLAEYIEKGYKGRYNDFEDVRNFTRLNVNYPSGNPLFLRDKTNVNMDWENYKKTGIFDSACYSGDLFSHGIDENACYDKPLDEKTLARSVNVAGFLGAAVKNREDGIHINTFTHLPVLLSFDQNDGKIKAFPKDKSPIEKYNEAISHHTHPSSDPKKLVLENIYYAIIQVPWDNFSDKELFSRIYMDGMTPLDYNKNTRGGFIPITDAIGNLPSGYLFRHHFAAVIDYEKA
jgi:hypothetical protein